MNTDLSAYVTERAMSGIFYPSRRKIKDQKGPAARVTDLLKRCLIKIDGSEGLKCFGLLTEHFNPSFFNKSKNVRIGLTFFL